MKKAIVIGLVLALFFSSLALLPAPTARAAETMENTPQWVLVQNLTFDDVNQINAIYVKGDSTNLSVAIENGMLNISVKSTLSETTKIYFFGFAPGASKWVVRYKAHNMTKQYMVICRTQIWAFYSVKIVHSDGTSTVIPCHTDDEMQTTTLVFNKTKHITVYQDGVEKGNATDYTERYYYMQNANVVSLYSIPIELTIGTSAPSGAYLTFDYIAEYKQKSDYFLDMDNIFFNRWDDNIDNFFANGLNEFKKRGWYGVMSVVTGTANWTNISKLTNAGWELADHTRNHVKLTDLPLADAKAEIANGKSDLQAHGYTVTAWVPPGEATNETLNKYAYNELGLRLMAFDYQYLCNDIMRYWDSWAGVKEHHGAWLGHQVRNDVIHGSTYITTENLSKALQYVEQQKLFVLGYSQIWDIALNQAYGTITRTANTDTEKTFSISGPGQWAEVVVKGDYTGDLWKVQDGHGRNLWHFYKDGYTYILVKLDAKNNIGYSGLEAGYSGIVKITKDVVKQTTEEVYSIVPTLIGLIVFAFVASMIIDVFKKVQKSFGGKW